MDPSLPRQAHLQPGPFLPSPLPRKGNPEYWVAEVRPGNVVYELDGVTETLAREAFALAAAKLPLKTTFVVRQLGA